MSKHTPGPWRVIPPYSGGHYAVQRGREGGFIVKGLGADRGEADARLIAAAPELLAALTMIYEITQTPSSDDWQSLQNIAATAATAIRKAEGRDP